jgi:hypothetical protein
MRQLDKDIIHKPISMFREYYATKCEMKIKESWSGNVLTISKPSGGFKY